MYSNWVLIVALTIANAVSASFNERSGISRIQGHVESAEGIPIASVVVRAWRAGKVDDAALTDGAGRFSLTCADGKPVEALTFEPPDLRFYGPAIIENLSGKHDQQINMVMFDPQHFKSILQLATNTEHIDLTPIRRQASAIDRMTEIESSLPFSSEADPSRFRPFIHRMRSDQALFGKQEAAEADSYLEAMESKLARSSKLRGYASDQYPSATSPVR